MSITAKKLTVTTILLMTINIAQAKTEQMTDAQASQARSALALTVIKALKTSSHDPSSLKMKSLGINFDATIACAEYRSKNRLGAVVLDFSVVNTKTKTITGLESDWNRHCTKGLYDMSPLYRTFFN